MNDHSHFWGTVSKPGYYRMSAERYHADPAPEPSLSAGCAITLLADSPAHAREDHPRLNWRWKAQRPTQFMIDGSILHHLLLGHGAELVVWPFDDWRTDRAKAAREETFQAGKMPVLFSRYRQLERVAAAARTQLRRLPNLPDGIELGEPEATLIWQEGTTWCRCRVDYLHVEAGLMVDLKFTSRLANVDTISRSAADLGYDVRAAHYARGFERIFGKKPLPYVFVTIELERPYGISITFPGEQYETRGRELWQQALVAFTACRMANLWPGYSPDPQPLDMPAYAVLQMEKRMERAASQLRGRIPAKVLKIAEGEVSVPAIAAP